VLTVEEKDPSLRSELVTLSIKWIEMIIRWERGSPEPLFHGFAQVPERLWRAALPAGLKNHKLSG
jgi:hypothetical protein